MCKITLQKTLADLPYSKNEYSFESKDLSPEEIQEHYKRFHQLCADADLLFSKKALPQWDNSLMASENKQLTEFKNKAMVFYQLLQQKNPGLYKEIADLVK